jgi:hypothetical protein
LVIKDRQQWDTNIGTFIRDDCKPFVEADITGLSLEIDKYLATSRNRSLEVGLNSTVYKYRFLEFVNRAKNSNLKNLEEAGQPTPLALHQKSRDFRTPAQSTMDRTQDL